MLRNFRSKYPDLTIDVLERENSCSPKERTPEPSPGPLPETGYESDESIKACKKRKRMIKEEEEEAEDEEESFEKCIYCDSCDFTTDNERSLEIHQKCHKIRQKCCYCHYETYEKNEMEDHWDVSHRPNEFRVCIQNFYNLRHDIILM